MIYASNVGAIDAVHIEILYLLFRNLSIPVTLKAGLLYSPCTGVDQGNFLKVTLSTYQFQRNVSDNTKRNWLNDKKLQNALYDSQNLDISQIVK